MNFDTDGDGLYDGSPRIVGDKKVAPVDPDALKPNGPNGIWQKHYEQESTGLIPDEYLYELPETEDPLIPTMGELLTYIKVLLAGVDVTDEDIQKCADNIVGFSLGFRETLLDNAEFVGLIAKTVKQINEGSAAVGAYLLDFKYDEYEIAYHSSIGNWQRTFGYNEMYDDIFKIGSYMNPIMFEFTADREYILWGWKGDYWNLQSGAEVGLYVYDAEYSGTKHYDVVDFELPMTLSLYNYNSQSDIENVFSWEPIQNQWWITGFNAHTEFSEPNPDVMVVVGSVDFTGHNDLYEALKVAESGYEQRKRSSLIFDDDAPIVWIIWEGK